MVYMVLGPLDCSWTQCFYKLLTSPKQVCLHKQGRVFIRNPTIHELHMQKKPVKQANSGICRKVCAIGAGARALRFDWLGPQVLVNRRILPTSRKCL